MTDSPIISLKTLSALVIACAMAAILAQPAAAQSVGKLKCTGCVKSKQVKNNGIKGKDIKDGQVKNPDLGANAVDGSKIADGSVGSADLGGNSVTRAKIADEPGVDSNQFTGAGDVANLSFPWTDLQSIPISHPGSGLVTCIATGTMRWTTTDAEIARLGWSTVSGDTAPTLFNFAQPNSSSASGPEIPISAVHTFTVTGPGTTIFHLKGHITTGNSGDVVYFRQAAACMYFPTQY